MSTLLLQGNARHIPLADGSIDLVVTSPPYYGLRSYGTNPQIWGGRDHAHEWGDRLRSSRANKQPGPNGVNKNTAYRASFGPLTPVVRADCPHDWGEGERSSHPWAVEQSLSKQRGYATGVGAARHGGGQYCRLCQAWRGELGSEPTVEQYIANMVEVFADVHRVLAPHGLLFLNLGDSYSGAGYSNHSGTGGAQRAQGGKQQHTNRAGLGEKQLLLVPFRLAMALQESGWILRQWHPWIKRNPMPDSAGDRAGVSVETFFQFARSARYYFDMEPVRRRTVKSQEQSIRDRERWRRGEVKGASAGIYHPGTYFANDPHPDGRQWRNSDAWFTSLDDLIEQEQELLTHLERVRERGGVLADAGELLALDVATYSYPGAHYATFGPRLIEPLIKAGTSEGGYCTDCGKPWRRLTWRQSSWPERKAAGATAGTNGVSATYQRAVHAVGVSHQLDPVKVQHMGWAPSCSCYDARYRAEQPRARSTRKQRQHDASGQWWRRVRTRPGNPDWQRRPGRVFDPFVGSGTTPKVAQDLGRDGVGLDLSHEYLRDQALPRVVAAEQEHEERTRQLCALKAAFAGEAITAPDVDLAALGPLFELTALDEVRTA